MFSRDTPLVAFCFCVKPSVVPKSCMCMYLLKQGLGEGW